MKIVVTGASGFVGGHLVAELVSRGHAVRAVARDPVRLRAQVWASRVELIGCDVGSPVSRLLWDEPPDALIHLAWPGLPNYRDSFHIECNLPADLRFIRGALDAGVPHVMVAGTCLEYGMQEGAHTDDADTKPCTPYGVAKDRLRRELFEWRRSREFTLQWMRLFYMHGPGQNPRSLLAQLDAAIDRGDDNFDMSPGDQRRDYLSIREVVCDLADTVESPKCSGIFNVCSGSPVTVADLVQRRCRERGRFPTLNFGVHPYPDYEPFSFWGIPGRIAKIRERRARKAGGP